MFVTLILSFIFKEIFLLAILVVAVGILFESYKMILLSFNIIFDRDYFDRIMMLMFITIMSCLLLYSSYYLYISERPLLIITILSIASADIFAYLFGKKFGKNKLAPSISPGKTWEGLFGGTFACIMIFALSSLFGFINLTLGYALTWGLVISLVSVSGDLFESGIKRKFGFKDSSNILGAHGGIFDRFDSYLFSIPVTLILQQLSR